MTVRTPGMRSTLHAPLPALAFPIAGVELRVRARCSFAEPVSGLAYRPLGFTMSRQARSAPSCNRARLRDASRRLTVGLRTPPQCDSFLEKKKKNAPGGISPGLATYSRQAHLGRFQVPDQKGRSTGRRPSSARLRVRRAGARMGLRRSRRKRAGR